MPKWYEVVKRLRTTGIGYRNEKIWLKMRDIFYLTLLEINVSKRAILFKRFLICI